MTSADLTFIPLFERPRAVSLVARWWFEEWGEDCSEGSFGDLVSALSRELDPVTLPIHVLAEQCGDVVGVATLRRFEMEDVLPGVENWLGSVYVARHARRRGVGAALVEEVERRAISRRIPELRLRTRRLDGGLYTELGWAREQIFEYRGRDLLVMLKRLEVPRRIRGGAAAQGRRVVAL